MNIELPDAVLDALADLVAERLALRFEQPEPQREWMNVRSLARYLDCSEGRIRKLVQRNRIPHSRDSDLGPVFFNRHDIYQWMRSQTREETR